MFTKEYKKSLKKIMTKGFETKPRGQKVRELINNTLTLEDPRRCFADFIGVREFPMNYLTAELFWYLSGDLKVDKIKKFAKLWDSIKNEKGKINSNYGYLVFHNKMKDGSSQYDWALNSLLKDKDSRQSIIRYGSEKHQYEGVKDFVCTINSQFFIRNDELIGIVNMRSSDAIYGATFDLPWFSLVQQSLFLDLKRKYKTLKLGALHFNAASFHVYENFFEKVKLMEKCKTQSYNFVLEESLTTLFKNNDKKSFGEKLKKLGTELTKEEYIDEIEKAIKVKILKGK